MFKKFGLFLVLLLSVAMVQAADKYAIDNVHTAVIFKINHLGVSNSYGRFDDVAGSFTWDDKDPKAISVDLVIKADKVNTNAEKRDQHLVGPDFFNAKQFPVIAFKSKSVTKDGKGFKVTGALTMHGVTKDISFNFVKVGEGKDPYGNFRLGGETTFTVKRSDFGMNYMVPNLGDDVVITVSLEGIKA